MLRNRVAIAMVAGLIGAVLSLAPAALADGHGGHGEGKSVLIRGTVTAFTLPSAGSTTTAGSMTVAESNGTTVTLGIASTTTIDMSASALAGLLAGSTSTEQVTVAVGGAAGSPTAMVVRSAPNNASGEGQNQNDHNQSVSGVVQAVASGSFTLQRENGTDVTVDVSATTAIKMGGQTLPASDIAAGARVEASGTLNADGSLAATVVRIANEQSDKAVDRLNGTVTAAASGSAPSFIVTTTSGTTVTVNLAANAIIRVGDHLGTAQDITQGAQVQILGTVNTNGSFTATLVKVSNDNSGNNGGSTNGG